MLATFTSFGHVRQAGESKLTMKQNIQYLEQLGHLYWDLYPVLVVVLFATVFAVLFMLSRMVGLV